MIRGHLFVAAARRVGQGGRTSNSSRGRKRRRRRRRTLAADVKARI